jgi:glyoxylase-like metal-dependent hydrolase (beta-lactamase superfamily II)
MVHSEMLVEPVVQELSLPAGIVGPVEVTMDVRCFIVSHPDGLLLIDTGLGSADPIGAALERLGADWDDVTDVVLTHAHPDHFGGLADVVARSPQAAVWAGARDCPDIPSAEPLRPLAEGDRVRNLQVVEAPGHTAGHICLFLENRILFVGDAVFSDAGALGRAPEAFTADSGLAEESLRKLARLQPERMLFSHGPEIPDPVGALQRLLQEAPEAR